MSLNWNFNEKVGELYLRYTSPENPDFSQDVTYHLYQGNAYLIVINQVKDEEGHDLYNLTSFFADKEHMKNMLGLNPRKGYRDNSFFTQPGWMMKGIRINKKKYRYTKDLVAALAQAFDDITIELFSE